MTEPAIAPRPRQSDTLGPHARTQDIPVTEVTLLEDRALVRRRGPVTVPPGRSRVRVEGVAPVLADKTLTAELRNSDGEPAPGMRVRNLEVARRRVTADAERPPDLGRLRAQRRAKEAELVGQQQRIARVEARASSIASIHDLTVAEIAEDVSWGREDLAEAGRQLDALEDELRALSDQSCELAEELAILERDLADLRLREAAGTDPGRHAVADLFVELWSEDEGERTVELHIDYVVPGAMWRPWHTARLHDGPAGTDVEIETAGCVWQATGEDWHDVQLVFSTERPSLGVTPPSLATDRLRIRKRGAAVEVQARDQKVHTAGLGAPAPVEAQGELPGIDDGGQPQLLRGRAPTTVPGDGRPHRVPITAFRAPAEVALVCQPEQVAAVMLRTRQVNGGPQPLLAGPVDLVRNHGLAGRTSILYVAPGERFELGWGPDPALRAHREVEVLQPERKTLSSWTRKPRRITIKLSNLAPRPAAIEVKERIAVSEVEKVEVEVVSTGRGSSPDRDGFVTWQVPLRGFGRDELTLEWTLVVHDDVVGL